MSAMVAPSCKVVVILLVLGWAMVETTHAQPLGEPGNLGPTPASPANAVPLDGGVSLLAGAAATLAGRKLFRNQKLSNGS